jgi:uncharacterized protein (DUF433 family)
MKTMTETINIGTLIDRSPGVHNNRPKVAGTGVTVRRIAGWYIGGCAPEEIVRKIPHLTLAQVHAALAYYYANREEIERDLAADEALYEKLAAEQAARAS